MKNNPLIILCIFFLFGSWSQISFGQSLSSIQLHEDLEIIPINNKVYIHKSWTVYPSFGRVVSNGLIYISGEEVVIMDTPVNDTLSSLLAEWIINTQHKQIKAVLINHFHSDCLGGLAIFHRLGIPSYATKRCQQLAKKNGTVVPKNGFRKKLNLSIGGNIISCRYFGKAHSADNMVAYIPNENLLYCNRDKFVIFKIKYGG